MKKVFILFFFVFTFFFAASLNWAADHTHFDTEKVKVGVVHYKAYRIEAEIAADLTSLSTIR